MRLCVCEDDEMPRIWAEHVIKAARANQSASQIIGEEYEEARSCAHRVMDLASAHGEQNVIVVLDQNIDQYSEGAVYGTDLCMQIRALGFRGTLLINSANDEVQDENDYLQVHTDCLIPSN